MRLDCRRKHQSVSRLQGKREAWRQFVYVVDMIVDMDVDMVIDTCIYNEQLHVIALSLCEATF